MDPNACLRGIHEALLDGDDDEAYESGGDLLLWLSRGGFEPDWGAYPEARDFVVSLLERQ